MDVRVDAVGNVVGRYEGTSPACPVLLIGSHIDTVRNAGHYDGNFGVIAAIAGRGGPACGRGERLPYAIEVLAFGDEEGVRFPVTLTGSRAVAGTLRSGGARCPRRRRHQHSARRCSSSAATRRHIRRWRAAARMSLGYVELHIEQGPVLEAEDLPVGVVTAINGAARFTIEVTGDRRPRRHRADGTAPATRLPRPPK